MSGEEFDKELSELFTTFWKLDINRCRPGIHYEVNLQDFIKGSFGRDFAVKNFFSWMNEDSVFQIETFKTFYDLLDNYENEIGKTEVVSEEEVHENLSFLTAILKTEIMKKAHAFLVAKNLSPASLVDFRRQLYNLWFKLYRRNYESTCYDSSGFEHVFVGETRDNTVLGLHNWIQFYLQEKAGNIDYKGFFRSGTSHESQPRVVTLQFSWKGSSAKPKGSTFVGTSPEFELAMYTVAFLVHGKGKVRLAINNYEIELTIHRIGNAIGTCFPQVIK